MNTMITLDEFLDKLAKLSYLKYEVYDQQEHLFITLYDTEDLEKYMIMESISTEQHAALIAALKKYKQ